MICSVTDILVCCIIICMIDENEDIGKINHDSSSDEEVIDSQNIQEELIEE